METPETPATAPVTTTAPVEAKLTVPQKVAALETEKATLVAADATDTDPASKVARAERITVIDRQLRWYAGRSGAPKAPKPPKAAKAPRPTKEPKAPKAPKTPVAPTAPFEPVAPAVNES